MTRFLQLLDRIVDLGLLFVLAFTPLAFGAVEEWAQTIVQAGIFVVFAAWILKLTWSPAPWRGPNERRAVLGGRVLLSGLELPALLFAAVVLLQLIPLPPSILRVISPRTAEIYAQSLPGYGESGDPSFAELPRWLQSDPEAEAGGVPTLPPDPDKAARAMPPEVYDLSHPAWRPLSLTPAHTSRALQIFLAHVMFFIVAFNHLSDRRRVGKYLVVLAGLAAFVAVSGILQSLTAGNQIYGWRMPGPNRSFGPFFNANNFAGWMELALPVSAGLAVMVWESQRRRAPGSPGLQERAGRSYAAVVALAFVAVIGLAAFVIAKSRGGVLSLGAAMTVLTLMSLAAGRVRVRLVIALLLLLAAAMSLAVWVDWQQIRERYETLENVEQDPSFRSRLTFSRRTLAMAADFPVLGTGLGTFEEAYALYSPGTSNKVLGKAHNDYAQVAAECGLAGAMAMLWGLFLLLTRGVGPGLLRGGSSFRWVLRGAAVGTLALLFHSFVDFNLQIYSNSILFVFLCALLTRERREVPRSARARSV